jgi:hypothetical protein
MSRDHKVMRGLGSKALTDFALNGQKGDNPSIGFTCSTDGTMVAIICNRPQIEMTWQEGEQLLESMINNLAVAKKIRLGEIKFGPIPPQ